MQPEEVMKAQRFGTNGVGQDQATKSASVTLNGIPLEKVQLKACRNGITRSYCASIRMGA